MKTAAQPESRRRPSTSRANTHTAICAARPASIAWFGSARIDSNARRHTSFASVDVLPEVDDTIDIVLSDEDLKRDVFRCGGPGGQHQNKTESGVRFTHLPTGIAAESRSERSQHKNGTYALALSRPSSFAWKKRNARPNTPRSMTKKAK